MLRVETLNYEVNKYYFVQEPAMVAAVDAVVDAAVDAAEAEPIAGPSGLCGQRPDAAP